MLKFPIPNPRTLESALRNWRYMSRELVPKPGMDTLERRPDATKDNAGWTYYATDTNEYFISIGGAWKKIK